MRNNKLLMLLTAGFLCLVLYTLVTMRSDSKVAVVFGGADGAYIDSDNYTLADPNRVEPTEAPVDDGWPKITLDEISALPYTMVNDDNAVSSSFAPEVAQIPGFTSMFQVDALPHLEALIEAIKDAGFTVYVAGGYRAYTYQEKLFNGKASQIAAGMGISDYLDPRYEEAVAEARTITAYPGCSEHQLGLAVDLMDRSYSRMVYENMNQEFFEWLDAHCAEYGFIKRYPTRKLLLTGWDEPWHYRYVGKEVATFIMEKGICYEEFYAHYVDGFTY